VTWLAATPAARAVDLLEALQPADYRIAPLAGAEARAGQVAVPLDPREWLPAGSPVGHAGGGTTLTELGLGGGSAQVEREQGLVAGGAAVDLRLLASPVLREALAGAPGSQEGQGGAGGLDLPGLLDQLGGGGQDVRPLEQLLDDGVLVLPELDVQQLVNDLDNDLLGGLLGGGRKGP
jgi:hypothetical protein